MASETAWSTVRLGDVAQIQHGWAFKSEFFSSDLTGHPIVVNIGNFAYSGGFRFGETAVREYRGTYPPEFELAPGDVLVVMTCQTAGGEILGIPGRIPDDGRTYLHNQRMGKVEVTRPDLVHNRWLYWVFLTPQLNSWLAASASGTKILHTSPGRIAEFKLALPPLNAQQADAEVLDALQDKIDLNRRINSTLESIAQTLFRSWFIDFDPVRARSEGRQPSGMDAETAALFPDALDDGPVGPKPAGWSVSEIGHLIEIGRVTVNPGASPDEEFDHFSLPAFDEGRHPRTESGHEIKSGKLVVAPDAVLLSKLNPHIPRIWMPEVGATRRAICSTEFLVCRPRPGISRSFLYLQLSDPSFLARFESLVGGGTNSHQRIAPQQFARLTVVAPPSDLIARFSAVADGLLDRVAANLRETTTLTAVRGALLPKLLSGEVRVAAAERSVGATV